MTKTWDLTYAVGDVHGQADLLASLQSTIAADARARGARAPKIVYLGDAVDRGPSPRECIDLQIDGLPGFEQVHLMGNHEDLMLGFLRDPMGDEAYTWLMNGGQETLLGYGVGHDGLGDIAGRVPEIRDAFEAALGPRHLAHLHALEVHHEAPEAIFVHAGLRPHVPLAEQDAHEKMWIRGAFLQSDFDWGKPVVHGHTPNQHGPELRPNRINVDTGAFKTGFLTAVALVPGEVPRFLVGARRMDWQLLVDPQGRGDDTWLDWSLAGAVASGAKAVGICSPHGARLAEVCSSRGLKAKPVTLEGLAALRADGTSDLAQAIDQGRATLCFATPMAHGAYREALRDAWAATASNLPTRR